MTYKTPGVYVEEISTLPPSVAEVSTAVPAFIGYTEKGPSIARINTLLDYEELFGGPQRVGHTVEVSGGKGSWTIDAVSRQDDPGFLMYHCVSHYFKNGGGSCYVVSTGHYDSTPAKDDFEGALGLVEKEDEPTLLLLTDAVHLTAADYYALCGQALAQCEKLGDRFAILDVKDGDVAGFRDQIGADHLMYGAAYHPYLETTLTHPFTESGVSVNGPSQWQFTSNENGVSVSFRGETDGGTHPTVKIVATGDSIGFEMVSAASLKITGVTGKTGAEVAAAWKSWKATQEVAGFEVAIDGDGTAEVTHTNTQAVPLTESTDAGATLAALSQTDTGLYNQIKTALAGERVVLPPSAALAGVYASVDRDRGVWKAPANVSLASVIGPVTKITHDEQESLNIDPTGGKSINAVRAFSGKGTLVWGARTLAGNDNEWRYVSVRRLFNLIEESSRKATSFAVFEPNDMTTWLKVKGMIEGYLYTLWERGALAGSTPEAAYYVHVGLGKTMTAQDVLEGRMHVEIGIAAVRPAEFVVLRFSHKLQEA